LEYNEKVRQLFIDLEPMIQLRRKYCSMYIVIEVGVPMKPVKLIKIYLDETYSKVHVV
jgi:hypothetical protein